MKLFTSDEEHIRENLRELGVRFYDEEKTMAGLMGPTELNRSEQAAKVHALDECTKQAQQPMNGGGASCGTAAAVGNSAYTVVRLLEERICEHRQQADRLRALEQALPKTLSYEAAEALLALLYGQKV